MQETLGCLFFFVLCCLAVRYCLVTRNFYKKNGTEVYGTVTNWFQYKDANNEICCSINVETDDGREFTVTSANIKARKYRHKKEITLLMAEDLPHPEFEPNLNLPESERQALLDKQNELAQKVQKSYSQLQSGTVMLKEDLPSSAGLIVSVFLAIVAGVLMLVSVYGWLFVK